MIKTNFLKSNLVKYDDPIISVIECLNNSSEKFCLVLTKKKKFVVS